MAVITSITGLQNLTGLVNFYADWNALTSVNLSGLTNLVDVDVSDQNSIPDNQNCLASINVSGCTALEQLRIDDSDFSGGFPNLTGLTNLFYLDIDGSNISGSVDLSGLPALRGFDFSDNTGLTSVTISSSQPLGDGDEILLYDCGLTQTAIDNILVALADNSVNGGYIDITGATNAAPGAAGLAALTVLDGKGWTYDVNS